MKPKARKVEIRPRSYLRAVRAFSVEFKRRVVECVLDEALRDPVASSAFRTKLKNSLAVPLADTLNARNRETVADLLTRAPAEDEGLAREALKLWARSKPELYAGVREQLESLGHSALGLNDMGTSLPNALAADYGLRMAMAEVIAAQLTGEDENDVHLMLCCVAVVREPEATSGDTTGASHYRDEAVVPSVTEMPPRYAGWLAELANLPAEAEEWDCTDQFVDALVDLVAHKLDARRILTETRTREKEREKVEAALSEIARVHGKWLVEQTEFDLERFRVPDLPSEALASFAATVARLADAVKAVQAILADGAGPLPTRLERQRQAVDALFVLLGDVKKDAVEVDIEGPTEPDEEIKKPSGGIDTAGLNPTSEPDASVGGGEDLNMRPTTDEGLAEEKADRTTLANASETADDLEVSRPESPDGDPEGAPTLDPEVGLETREPETRQDESAPDVERRAVETPIDQSERMSDRYPDIAPAGAPAPLGDSGGRRAETPCPGQGGVPTSIQPTTTDSPRPGPTVADLLEAGRPSLAYHLARVEDHGPFSAPLVSLALLGPHVRTEFGEVAATMRANLEAVLSDQSTWLEDADNQVRGLLVVAGCLRLGLLGHGDAVAPVLESARHLPSSLFADAADILEFCRQGRRLDRRSLYRVKDEAARERELRAVIAEARSWYTATSRPSNSFAPAGQVWMRWHRSDRIVGRLIAAVVADDQIAYEALRAESPEVQDLMGRRPFGEVLRQLADATYRTELRRNRGPDIQGTALDQLGRSLRQAISFVERWQRLRAGAESASARRHVRSDVEALRDRLEGRRVTTVAELEALSQDSRLGVRCAARLCMDTVRSVGRLLTDADDFDRSEPVPGVLLSAELLSAERLPLDLDWLPEDDEATVRAALHRLAEAPPLDWSEAFDRQLTADWPDLEVAQRLLLVGEWRQSAADVSIPDARRAALEDLRLESRRRLADYLGRLRSRLASALEYGQITSEDYGALGEPVRVLEEGLAEVERTWAAHARGEALHEELERRARAGIEPLIQRFQSLPIGTPEDRARIQTVIERNDVHTANEYLQLLESGQPLPTEEPRFRALWAFQAVQQPLNDELSRTSWNQVVRVVAEGRPHPPLVPERLDQRQRRVATDGIKAWATLKQTRDLDGRSTEILKVLQMLGFELADATVESARYDRFSFVSKVVEDRETCPVPAFGSAAEGRYRVQCVWERPHEQDLARHLDTVFDGQHGLLFYFGRLSAAGRNEISRRCRERQQTYLTVDDVLMMHVATHAGSRLSRLFNCGLPYAYTNPYSPAGRVPPEMFYGRRSELSDLLSGRLDILYGGRQLGKSALLLEAARRLHRPPKRIARVVDLKTNRIGFESEVGALWRVLRETLGQYQIVPTGARRTEQAFATRDEVRKAVLDWLRADGDRQIVMLLDEADRFLEGDRRQAFVNTDALIQLRRDSGGRFRFVFAGLHNVYRTTKDGNHALAQLQPGASIGPLLERGEAAAARRLIHEPLAAAGIRLENEDLATRILAQTNYFPSLIQVYCDHLLREFVSGHLRASFADGPPYVLTEAMLREAYNAELRARILDKFNLTLQLDARYLVLAQVLAYETVRRASADGVFTQSWIQDQALYWWSDGFRETIGQGNLGALLDEMVELGVLRRPSPGRYALRSPNVALLLGTEEELANKLLESERQERPLEYRPDATRRPLITPDGHPRLAPLTLEQDAVFGIRDGQVIVVTGTEMAGLSDLPGHLSKMIGPSCTLLDADATDADFERELGRLTSAARSGAALLVVGHNAPWNRRWLAEAKARLSKLGFPDPLHIVFLANEAVAWSELTVGGPPAEAAVGPDAAVRRMALSPWNCDTLRQYLEEREIVSVSREDRQVVLDATGGWPTLIYDLEEALGSLRSPTAVATSVRDRLNDASLRSDYLHAFGLSSPIRTRVLENLTEEGWTPRLLCELLDVDPQSVRTGLRWADALRYVTHDAPGVDLGGDSGADVALRLNPFLARLLSHPRS